MSSQYVARRYFIRSAMLVRNFVTNYLATGRNYVRIVPDDVCGIVVIYHHVAATRQHSASNKISSSMNHTNNHCCPIKISQPMSGDVFVRV